LPVSLEQYKKFDLENSEILAILLGIFTFYIVFSIPELYVDECEGFGHCFDFDRRMGRLYVWNTDNFFTDFRHSLHFGLLVFSNEIFGNYKVLVLVSSTSLILISYLFTKKITGKRYAGVLAIGVLLGSKIFYTYDTSVTYPSFWSTFYILSLYLIVKKPYLSILPYFLSIPMKMLTILYLPANLAFIAFLNIDKKSKIKQILIYVSIISLIVGIAYLVDEDLIESSFVVQLNFKPYDFISGIGDWANTYRFDVFGLFMLFIVICLLIMLKKVPYSKAVLLVIFLMLMTSPFLRGFSTYDNWPYRYLPIVTMVAIGFGLVVCNLDKIDFSRFSRRNNLSVKI